MEENIFLRINILLHILVDIQMVGGQICHHSHIRAFTHGDQLKAGKLHHSTVLRLDGLDLRQQGPANISSQVNGLPLGFQKFCDNGGGSGFTVAAGNGIDLAGAKLKKHFHFAGDHCSPFPGGFQLGKMIPHTGCAENNILV